MGEGASIPEQDEAITHFHLLHSLLMGLASSFASRTLIIINQKSNFIRDTRACMMKKVTYFITIYLNSYSV